MLVSCQGEEVGSVDISPVPLFGNICGLYIFVGSWGCDHFDHVFGGRSSDAGLSFLLDLRVDFSEKGKFLNSGLFRKMLLMVSQFGLVSDVLGPGILGYAIGAVLFDIQIVDTPDESEVASDRKSVV